MSTRARPRSASPVLLITFNRPDTTQQVIDVLRDVRPEHVFVFSDGPRAGVDGEADLVAATRDVIAQHIDWSPRLEKRYNDANQGLFAGVTGALDWFFSRVPEGIILEDDCVPHPDFFAYCDELLERYREDDRVWCVSGDNSMDLPISGEASYGFIRDPLIWGWATWARAWKQFDPAVSSWDSIRGTAAERELYPDRVERRVRRETLDRYLASGIDAWGFRWKYTVHRHRGLVAVPRVNLVSNIGWNRADATHTTGSSLRAAKPTTALMPLTHPAEVSLDTLADREWVESRGLGVKKYRASYQIRKLIGRIRRGLGRMMGR